MISIITGYIGLMITILIFVIPVGLIVGIVLAIVAYTTKDLAAKNRAKAWMWRAFLGPVGVLILLVILNGLAELLANT